MRVLVTGARGLLGSEVCDALGGRGHEAMGFGREFDVTNPETVAGLAVEEFGKLDWIINCAAYTAVDLAENERQQAYELNALAPSYLSAACGMAGIRLLHISTDFVFDGSADKPYTEEDAPNPTSYYGTSKLEGEKALQGNHRALVVRTSWLFGPRGRCFPKSILNAYDAGKPLRVVNDQVGCPTYTPALAQDLVKMIEIDPFPGIYHLAGATPMSWYAFARKVLQVCRDDHNSIEAIGSAEWPTPAVRPKFSVLDTSKAQKIGMPPMRPLQDCMEDFCRQISFSS